MISNQLLWLVLSTPNLDPSRSTLPQFKIFKFHSLQVWTRFIIFGEIHIFSSPKILPKIRQPPGALRGHLTKDQLQINFPHAKNISSNTWRALFLSKFRKFRVSVMQFCRQCRFFRTAASISPVCTLAPCSLLLLLIQCAARSFGWAQASVATCLANSGVFCGGRTTRSGQQGPALPFGAVQHRPSHPKPPRGHPLPRARYSIVAVA